MPRSTSWTSQPARAGGRPSWAATWTSAVLIRAGAGERGSKPASSSRGSARAREPVERDDRLDPVAVRGGRGEPLGAEAAVGAAVRGEEDERVLGRRPARHRPEPAVAARELDQRRGSGGVVVRAGPDARVVAVGEDEDRVVRRALHDRDEVLEPDAAETGDALVPVVLGGGEAVERRACPSPTGLLPRRRPSRADGRDSRAPARSRAPRPRGRRTRAAASRRETGRVAPIVSASRRRGPSTSSDAARTSRPLIGWSTEPRLARALCVPCVPGSTGALADRLARMSLRPPRRGL